MIEALAGLEAADELFVSLAGGTDCPLSDFFHELGLDLQERAFGRASGDEWVSAPPTVAVQARGAELAADALDRLELGARAGKYRRWAGRVLESGTIDVDWVEAGEDA
jgi:hypothetical protein